MVKKYKCPSRTNGTLEHFKTSRWGDIKKRTNKTYCEKMGWNHYKNINLKMTKDEFYKFCDTNKKKISALKLLGETPSVNRIDPDGHYEISNIEIISLSQNSSLTRKPTRKYIIATNLKTKEEVELPGCWSKEAIAMGFDPSSIQKICKKVTNKGFQYHGYTFRYKGETNRDEYIYVNERYKKIF